MNAMQAINKTNCCFKNYFNNVRRLFYLLIAIYGGILMPSCDKTPSTGKSDHRFYQLQQQVAEIDEPERRQAAVDQFLKELGSGDYPIFENDSTVVLLYQSKADSVFLLGDMSLWVDYLPYQHLAGTDLFFLRSEFEPQARLQYWIMLEKEGFPALDPLNPYKVSNGFGEMSELAMPAYQRHPYFNEYLSGKKGDDSLVTAIEIGPGALPYPHQLHIYLPPAYEKNNQVYPVVYFQDGIDYIEFAMVPQVLNKLISERKIEPLIAVFVTPPNRFKEGTPNRMTEYGLNENYVRFFTDQLTPFIDSKYRTRKEANTRLVVGDSFGGLISAYIPFARPDVFKLGYSQSGYHSFQNDQIIKRYRQSERKSIRLYVDVGTYERAVGASFLPSQENDFLLANRRFKTVLQEKEYDFVYREYFEGHTWGNWRRHLIDGLIHFFGTDISE
jgi:enterochelin esterase-like enzyme